jgi:hypothetical protein
MSLWDSYQIGPKVLSILNVQSHEPKHTFGRPFLTPYQIAIEFKRLHPVEFRKIGKPCGGKNIGQQDSLAQYIASELSRRIQAGEMPNVEGRFLYRQHLRTLQYDDGEQSIESSSLQSYDLSIYRQRN